MATKRVERTRVKICGITRPEDGAWAGACGADAVGLVFYPPSPRAVDPERAREVVAALPPFVTVVALFVDPEPALVRQTLAQIPVDLLQFHGDEPPDWARAVLEGRDRRLGGVTAPPQGLYLVGVEYPERFGVPPVPPLSPSRKLSTSSPLAVV